MLKNISHIGSLPIVAPAPTGSIYLVSDGNACETVEVDGKNHLGQIRRWWADADWLSSDGKEQTHQVRVKCYGRGNAALDRAKRDDPLSNEVHEFKVKTQKQK